MELFYGCTEQLCHHVLIIAAATSWSFRLYFLMASEKINIVLWLSLEYEFKYLFLNEFTSVKIDDFSASNSSIKEIFKFN